MKNDKKIVVKTVKVAKENKPKKAKKNNGSKSLLVKTVSAPMAIGSRVNRGEFYKMRGNPKYPGSIRVRGHELLQMVNVNNDPTKSNTLGACVFLNPTYFEGTRVAKMASLYEKFKFNKMQFHFASSRPTTSAGQYLMSHDTDYADDTPGTDDVGTRAYFAMKASTMRNVWESATLTSKITDPQDFYYTNDTGFDGRLVYQGQLYVALLNAGITTTVNLSGSLWMEYELDLFDPQTDTNLYKPTSMALEDKKYTWLKEGENTNDFFNNYDTLQIAKPIQRLTDSDGNTFLRFPPGLWEMDWSVTTDNMVTEQNVRALMNLTGFKAGVLKINDNGEMITPIQASIPPKHDGQVFDEIFWGYFDVANTISQGLNWFIEVSPLDKFKDIYVDLQTDSAVNVVLPFVSSIFNAKKATSYPLGYGNIAYLGKASADRHRPSKQYEKKSTNVEPLGTPARNRSIGRV